MDNVKLDTHGIDIVIKERLETMPDGALKDAFIKVLNTTDVIEASAYYARLNECWGVTGDVNNIDPEYLLTGSFKPNPLANR